MGFAGFYSKDSIIHAAYDRRRGGHAMATSPS
jgi:hypothetical protein